MLFKLKTFLITIFMIASLFSIGFASWEISLPANQQDMTANIITDSVIVSDNIIKINYGLGDKDLNGNLIGYSRLVFNNLGFVGTTGNQMTVFYKIDMTTFCEEFGTESNDGTLQCSSFTSKFVLICNEDALTSLKPNNITIKFSTDSNMTSTRQAPITVSSDKMIATVSVQSSLFGKTVFTAADGYIYASITFDFANTALTSEQIKALQNTPFAIMAQISDKLN